jgi:O-antigen/teichoic acid export membrane protein
MLETEPGETPVVKGGGAIRGQLFRLARHSLVYGLGGVISRIVAIFLLPIYTHYLPTGAYGVVGMLLAAEAVMTVILRAGVQNAYFRFYYESSDPIRRRTVVRTSFWFTMTTATIGLLLGLVFAPQIAVVLNLHQGQINLVRATAVLLWADMNYQQQTALFRAEERSTSYAIASITNIAITIGATVLLVVGMHKGPLGLIVGNFTGTLCVYAVLLIYRLRVLGFEFSWRLYRVMEHFGLPLVPSALMIVATRFWDRLFVLHFRGENAAGIYFFGVTIASLLVLLITAFQLAWPAFAYSIEDDDEARRTYAHVLTYFTFVMIWPAIALSLLAPPLAHFLGGRPAYHPGARFVPLLALSNVFFAAYTVVSISIGRVRRTGANWIITGAGALVDVILNVTLVPYIGAMGAAIAGAAAFGTMFVGMSWHAQRLFHVPYQWRRLVTMFAVGTGIVVAGRALSLSVLLEVAVAAAFPLALFAFGFYSAAERAQLAALARRILRTQPA